jgi:hypothetical protein
VNSRAAAAGGGAPAGAVARADRGQALYSWDDALDSNAIEVHVHHLRKKLGDGVIRTLRGVGYFGPSRRPGRRAMMRAPVAVRPPAGLGLGALALVWVSFIVVGYQTGRHETDELTDGHLASVASAAGRADGHFATGHPAALADVNLPLKSHDYQQSMSVVVWDAEGRPAHAHRRTAPTPPFARGEGFETLQLGTPPQAWRSFSRWDGRGASAR